MRVTLNGLKSIGCKVDARWLKRKVWIWSREHGAYWRPDAAGYTTKRDQAGVYDFEDAFDRTEHCGREKKIEYIAIPKTKLTMEGDRT